MSNRIKSHDIQIGNSYVLPIEQSNVTLQQAKVKKIIEETDARAQEIINGAENKSNIIIETANTEAIRIEFSTLNLDIFLIFITTFPNIILPYLTFFTSPKAEFCHRKKHPGRGAFLMKSAPVAWVKSLRMKSGSAG